MRPALVFLHFFGSAQGEWRQVRALLPLAQPVYALDLPGFGEHADLGALDVSAMADWLDRWLRMRVSAGCVLVGHSMGGKVALALASRIPDYLRGLVLITPSPPGPEPMPADTRVRLLAFDGGREAATDYVDSVTSRRLPDLVRDPAIAAARGASLRAWRGWIERGSQEDWTGRVGVIKAPSLVIAASEDASLGASVQARLTLPHLTGAPLVTVIGGHALPLENPHPVATHLEAFMHTLSSTHVPAFAG